MPSDRVQVVTYDGRAEEQRSGGAKEQKSIQADERTIGQADERRTGGARKKHFFKLMSTCRRYPGQQEYNDIFDSGTVKICFVDKKATTPHRNLFEKYI